MEALAESASAVAVASITIQSADQIDKLFAFWESSKDAPEDVRRIAENLELLSSVPNGI